MNDVDYGQPPRGKHAPSPSDISVSRMQIISERYARVTAARLERLYKVTPSVACALFYGPFKPRYPGDMDREGYVIISIDGERYDHIRFPALDHEEAYAVYLRKESSLQEVADATPETASSAPKVGRPRKSRSTEEEPADTPSW